MYDSAAVSIDDDKLEMIHCVNCGAPIGKFGDGSTADLVCPRCKEKIGIQIRKGAKLSVLVKDQKQ